MDRISKLANLLALEPENRSVIRELNKEFDRRGLLYFNRKDIKAEVLNETHLVHLTDIVRNTIDLSNCRKIRPVSYFYFTSLSKNNWKLKSLISELAIYRPLIRKIPLSDSTSWISNIFKSVVNIDQDIYLLTDYPTELAIPIEKMLADSIENIFYIKFLRIIKGTMLLKGISVKKDSRVVVPLGKEAVYTIHILNSKDENQPVLLKTESEFCIDASSTLFSIESDEEI